MGFSNNYKEARENTFDNKPEGEYEVIIKQIDEHGYTKDGVSKSRLSLKLLIRNDVDQPAKNGYLFHSYFQRKTPTTQDFYTHYFPFSQMMWLSQQAGVPDGKNYETFEEFCKDLIDKCIRVKMEYDNDRAYRGNPQEKIIAIMKTKYPECKHIYREQPAANNGFAAGTQQFSAPATAAADISTDDDLPF